MCFNNEEWWKIWKRIDLSAQSWHERFAELWSKHSKNLKTFHFNGLLLSKVYNIWVKKVQRSYVWRHWRLIQIEGKLTCASKNDMRNLENFHQSTRKSQNWNFDGILLSIVEFTGELCVMTIKNDATFEKELTCQFKIDMRDLLNFNLNTQKI